MKNVRAIVRKFARQLRCEFAGEIERNPNSFSKHVVRLLKAALPLKHGRPQSEAVSVATEMRVRGRNWRTIYAACISDSLAADSRQLAQLRLRSAVRKRRRRLSHRS